MGKGGSGGGAPGHPSTRASQAFHCGVTAELVSTPNQGVPPPHAEMGKPPRGMCPCAHVPWRVTLGGSYLVGLPDGAQWDPHRPHHGVPNQALVPHLHCQAQVQAVDLTMRWGRNWGHPLPICPSVPQGSAGAAVRGRSRGGGSLRMKGAGGWGDPGVHRWMMQGEA